LSRRVANSAILPDNLTNSAERVTAEQTLASIRPTVAAAGNVSPGIAQGAMRRDTLA